MPDGPDSVFSEKWVAGRDARLRAQLDHTTLESFDQRFVLLQLGVVTCVGMTPRCVAAQEICEMLAWRRQCDYVSVSDMLCFGRARHAWYPPWHQVLAALLDWIHALCPLQQPLLD